MGDAHCGAFGECKHRYLVAAPAVRLGSTVFLPGAAPCRLVSLVLCLADGHELNCTTPRPSISSVPL